MKIEVSGFIRKNDPNMSFWPKFVILTQFVILTKNCHFDQIILNESLRAYAVENFADISTDQEWKTDFNQKSQSISYSKSIPRTCLKYMYPILSKSNYSIFYYGEFLYNIFHDFQV